MPETKLKLNGDIERVLAELSAQSAKVDSPGIPAFVRGLKFPTHEGVQLNLTTNALVEAEHGIDLLLRYSECNSDAQIQEGVFTLPPNLPVGIRPHGNSIIQINRVLTADQDGYILPNGTIGEVRTTGEAYEVTVVMLEDQPQVEEPKEHQLATPAAQQNIQGWEHFILSKAPDIDKN